ncbi:hypothetical protein NW762_010260 [Fusarium torreyae]|uniref:Uncharacterized protein n=1 Tax=Fusarium torreyae TaxID=1237075 RepID=A0A9W8RTE3_9HYPO|nr:hypothetical protein NW762_010260 [Fusarium torreyae]
MPTKRVTRSSRPSSAPAAKLKRPVTPDNPAPDPKRRKIDQAQVHSESKRQEVNLLLQHAQNEFYSADQDLQVFTQMRNDAWQNYQNAIWNCNNAHNRKEHAKKSIVDLKGIQEAQHAVVKRQESQVKLSRIREEFAYAIADFEDCNDLAKKSEEKIEDYDFESLFSKRE